MEILRFTTAGSVDDGKSTLIGRLLHDTKSILEDQLQAIEAASSRAGFDSLNLALITDGLRAEREQGITIDVAYRYFSTSKRSFIIADTPGHIQYTRNMITGASTANLALVLVDARKGMVEQSYRHCLIASLLRIPHLVICINKMDLVEYSESVFQKIRSDFTEFSKKLEVYDVEFIPVSALHGDNIVERSQKMPWYKGRSILEHLEEVHIASDENHIDFRFPVQCVLLPQSVSLYEKRCYAGTISSGSIRKGEEIVAVPSGFKSKVKSIKRGAEELDEATVPMSISIELENEIDLSRGDMIAKSANQPTVTQDIDLMICWMDQKPMNPSGRYLLMHTSQQIPCVIQDIQYKIDINTLHRLQEKSDFNMNDVGRISVRTSKPLLCDPYRRNRRTGTLILIDELTYQTVAAGMIL